MEVVEKLPWTQGGVDLGLAQKSVPPSSNNEGIAHEVQLGTDGIGPQRCIRNDPVHEATRFEFYMADFRE